MTRPWDDLLVGDELAYRSTEPSRTARLEALPADLDHRVTAALGRMGIDGLYAHQGATWEAATRGENVLVTTGTASGKSLAFNLPVLDAIVRVPTTRAIYLYPTKALTQDQARGIAGFRLPGVRPAIYDGDTEPERRGQIRKSANLILTNPDMLHLGILPHHDRWGDVLHNLRYVVIDEAHVYRGVFGSHVGNVIRRLRRIARIYGAEPLFLLASATIANPDELAVALTGEMATIIETDTSARAQRDIVLWNPALLDPELGVRASALSEASLLMAGLVSRGLRTICFTKSRKAAELIHRFTTDRVDTATAARLAPYRAGYTPAQRRDRARKTHRDRAVESTDVDSELEGVRRCDAEQLTVHQAALDLSPLRRRVSRPVGRESRCGRSIDPLRGEAVNQLGRLAALGKADRAKAAGDEPGHQQRRLGERARADAQLRVEQGRVPQHDVALGVGGRVDVDDRRSPAREGEREVSRVRDRGRGEQEDGIRAVCPGQPPQAP